MVDRRHLRQLFFQSENTDFYAFIVKLVKSLAPIFKVTKTFNDSRSSQSIKPVPLPAAKWEGGVTGV